MDTIRKSVDKKKGNPISRWIILISSILLLFVFITTGLPYLSDLFGFTESHQVIIDEDIWAGEWFYVFVDQIRDIEPRIRDALQYTPDMNQVDPAELN